MKKLLLCFLITPFCAQSQISLEHTFDTGSTRAHVIEDGELVYSRVVSVENQFDYSNTITFYDVNYQIIGTVSQPSVIPHPVPRNVSRYLWNTDDAIEFSLDCGAAFDTNSQTRVLSIGAGTSVLDTPCSGFSVYQSENGVKALADCYTVEDDEVAIYTRVYALPGSLPSGMAEQGSSELLAFPNPSSKMINIPVDGPGTIEVYNLMGQKVIDMPTSKTGYQVLEVGNLNPGTYIYQTRTNDQVQPGKSFVVY